MSKILYHDQNGFNNRMTEIKKGLEPLQNLLNEFNKTDLFKISTNKELSELIDGSEKYIKERLAMQIEVPKFGGFFMKKAAFVDTLELPSFDKINSLAVTAQDFVKNIKYFAIKGAKVVTDDKEVEVLREQYSCVAITKEQIRYGEAFTKVSEALTEYHNSLKALNKIGLYDESKFMDYFRITEDKVTPFDYWFEQNKYLFS